MRAGRRFVCMIAYTDYTIDARVRREAETLAAQGFDVRCLTTTNADVRKQVTLNGVEIRELRVRKYRGKSTAAYVLSYVLFLLYSSAACLRLLLRGELDVVHVHNIPDFLVLAGLIPRLGGSKVVLDVHDSVPETFATKFTVSSTLRKALLLEERLSALVAHIVICVNDPQRQTLVARGIPRAKTFISMNVPDPSIFAQPRGRDASGDASRGFNLVYHGTMARRLGVDLIIRAVAEVQERIPCIQLHLWGHGDDLAEFQRIASELGIANRVHFAPKGFALHELPARLSLMHVGVVGNRKNIATDLMLPVKLMEYVSQDIPSIAPRLRAIEHYFGDDMVTYYEPENVSSLADAIHRLYLDPARRAGQVQRARDFLHQYGWERQGTELVNLYQSLCGELSA